MNAFATLRKLRGFTYFRGSAVSKILTETLEVSQCQRRVIKSGFPAGISLA